jgi:hypothetical protein
LPGVVYTFFYPDGTDVTFGGLRGCGEFLGYHESLTLNDGTNVAYAVVPRCYGAKGLDVLDSVTLATSHELIEACTDLFPDDNPAYQLTDANHAGWLLLGGEVADMCELLSDAAYRSSDYPFFVQRVWSNSRAYGGVEPCVPAAAAPYFYAAPVYSDAVTVPVGNTTLDAACVYVPIGTATTIPVQLVGHGATGTMVVKVLDAAQLFGRNPYLDLTLTPNSGQSGDTLQLTIKKTGKNPDGISGFLLVTELDGRESFFWGLTSD